MLDRPVQDNVELRDLFSRVAPWDLHATASHSRQAQRQLIVLRSKACRVGLLELA